MLFSSREPFNDDPFPRQSHTWPEPDPAWNRPQHNPTNPILTDFRSLHESTGNDLWADAYLFSSDLIEVWDTYVIKDHWHHAMDVLNRIVRLSKLN